MRVAALSGREAGDGEGVDATAAADCDRLLWTEV